MKNSDFLKLLLLFIFLLAVSCSTDDTKKPEDTKQPAEYVNPFVGTAAYGHTFPGAALPFGMVQISPSTGAIRDKGYSYSSVPHGRDSETIIGFTHTNVSGTGIGHVAKYANISLTPTVGSLQVVPGSEEDPDSGYRSRYSHDQEAASPGYYMVMLQDYNVRAELTATSRAGLHRYTFPETDNAHIVIDITRERLWPALNDDAFIEIVGDNQIQGYTKVIGHHSGEPMTWYFYAEFSRPFDSFGAFSESTVVERQRSALGNNGVGAYVSYSTEDNEEIIAKVGISFTSIEGAKKNLHAEVEGWNFDRLKKAAEDTWNIKLNKISVSGGKLEFEMGPDPNTEWGSSPAEAPPSMSKK